MRLWKQGRIRGGFFFQQSSLFISIVFLGICFFIAPEARGQQSGALSGQIKDPTGALVKDAVVKAVNRESGATRTVNSSDSGTYVLSPLSVGAYSLEVTKDGFKTLTRTGIVVDINAALTLDLELTLGDTSERVEVSSTPPVIDTENQEIGNLRLPEQIENLPIIVREVQTLVGQTPGVPYGTGGKTASDTDTIGGTFSQGRASQQVLADGAQLNPFQTTGYPAIDGIGRRAELSMPNIDVVHEFRLVTNGASAEYGQPVSIIVATKSGGNSFHGDAFESYQSGGLSAKVAIYGVPGPIPALSFVRHQFGGSVSGPIKKDKLQFASAFEEFSHVRILSTAARYPTDSERKGDLSSILPAGCATSTGGYNAVTGLCSNGTRSTYQLYEPTTTVNGARQPVPFNRLDLDANTPISPVSAQLLNLVPSGVGAPVGGSAFNAVYSKPQKDISQKYDGRIDWSLNTSNSLFFHTTVGHINQAFVYTGAAPGTYGIEVKNYYTQVYTGTYSHVFTPNLLLKTTFSRRNNPFKNTPTFGDQQFPVAIAGLTARPPFAGPPAVTMGTNRLGISDFANRQFLNFSDDNDYQFAPGINYTVRKHNLIAGMFYLHGNKTAQLASPPWGQFVTASDYGNPTSTTSVTGDAYADFLLGFPSSTDVTTGVSGGYLTKQNVSFYFQDNWKPSANLTINLGLRYDNYGFFRPGDQRYANADVVNGRIVIPDGTLNLVQSAFAPFTSTFESAGSQGLNNSLTKSNNLAFVPRIGMAYRLPHDAVVRAGFGVYNNDVNNNYLSDGINSPPFTFRSRLTRNLTASNGINDAGFTFQNPTASGSTVSAATTLASFGGWTPSYPVNRAYEYNLTVEKQIGRYALNVSYAGNVQTGLSRVVQVNGCVPGPVVCSARAAAAADHRKFLNFGTTFGQQAANGVSNYNAIYAEVQRRFHSGFGFDLNYSHARLFTLAATASNPVQDPASYYDYGPVQAQPYDILHYNHVMDFPFGRGKKFGANMGRAADLVAGGWKLSGVGTWQSGSPLTVLYGSGQSPTGASTNRADRICNGGGGTPDTPGVPHSGTWFNTACYTAPGYVSTDTTLNRTRNFGTAAIGTVMSPRAFSYDANLQKSFTAFREHTFVLRFDVFNVFNHPILAPPTLDASANAANFGRITAPVSTYQQRAIQFTGRYNF